MRNWITLFENVVLDILWHGSDQKVEAPYRPLTHFGTELAANQRAMAVLGDWKRAPEPTYGRDGPVYPERIKWMHPVHLNIRNPLSIHDGVNLEHTPLKLADMLFYDLHVISEIERSAIFRAGNFANGNDVAGASAAIIKILAAKGYDGLVYRNLHEDPGSESYVIFYPEQVTPAGEPFSDQVD